MMKHLDSLLYVENVRSQAMFHCLASDQLKLSYNLEYIITYSVTGYPYLSH